MSDTEDVKPIRNSALPKDSKFPERFPVIVQMDPLGGHFQLQINAGGMMSLISQLRKVNELTDEGKRQAARLLGQFVIDCNPSMVLRPFMEPEKSAEIRKGHEMRDAVEKMGARADLKSEVEKMSAKAELKSKADLKSEIEKAKGGSDETDA